VGKLLCLIGCGGLVSPSPGIVSIAVLKICVRIKELDDLVEPYSGENVWELLEYQRHLHILIIDDNLDPLRGVGQVVEPLRVPPPAIGSVWAHVAVRVKHAIIISGHSHIQIVDAL
jgi:hypothetical protein